MQCALLCPINIQAIQSATEARIKGIVIAATKSGSGKTTLTLSLMAALARRGITVAPFKVGPDFIDPGHHTRITGTVSRNLDGWMLPRDHNLTTFARHARSADIAVIEGVMGLFDGYDGRSEAGSTAQMAKWLGLPVVLVVDAQSMARSAAALVQGFERFDPDLQFAGVIFNRIGSPRHLAYLQEALHDHVTLPCLGGLPRAAEIVMPERHLGLVTDDEFTLGDNLLDRMVRLLESHIDIDELLNHLPETDPPVPAAQPAAPPTRARIGVARDAAFCFYYADTFDLLTAHGAELIFFSPLTDKTLPPDLDGLYFGGGYPELFAAPLTANRELREQIRRQQAAGMPIYGECGGFMYLCRRIIDTHDTPHAMVGCFPFDTQMQPRLRALGYREIITRHDTLLGPAGTTLRGHEFHYSALTADSDLSRVPNVYRTIDRRGQDLQLAGYQTNHCLASYLHLHLASNPDAARHWVAQCAAYRQARERHA